MGLTTRIVLQGNPDVLEHRIVFTSAHEPAVIFVRTGGNLPCYFAKASLPRAS